MALSRAAAELRKRFNCSLAPGALIYPTYILRSQFGMAKKIGMHRSAAAMIKKLRDTELIEIDHEGYYMIYKQWPNIINKLAGKLHQSE